MSIPQREWQGLAHTAQQWEAFRLWAIRAADHLEGLTVSQVWGLTRSKKPQRNNIEFDRCPVRSMDTETVAEGLKWAGFTLDGEGAAAVVSRETRPPAA